MYHLGYCRKICIESYLWLSHSPILPQNLASRSLMNSFWLVVTSLGKLPSSCILSCVLWFWGLWIFFAAASGTRLLRMMLLCILLFLSPLHLNMWMCLGGSNTLMHFWEFRTFWSLLSSNICNLNLWYLFLWLSFYHFCYFLLLFINYLFCSGVSGEGSGVIVEGFAPATEEAVATPAAADTKVC